jgi:hypothetical protein
MEEIEYEKLWERQCMPEKQGVPERERKRLGLYAGDSYVLLCDERTGDFDVQFDGCENFTKLYKSGFVQYVENMNREVVTPKVFSLNEETVTYKRDTFIGAGEILGAKKVEAELSNERLSKGIQNGDLMVRRFDIREDAPEKDVRDELRKMVEAFVTALNSKEYETDSTDWKQLRDFAIKLNGLVPGTNLELRFINTSPDKKLDVDKILSSMGLVKDPQLELGF